LNTIRFGYFPAEIAVVVSDHADAAALALAREAEIPAYHVPHPSRTGFAIGVGWPLVKHKVDLIVLAGFMRILQQGFVMRWSSRIVNIHPSLLPSFRGLHPQRQALQAGHQHTGCTVHWVVPEVDAGEIIGQAVVPILAGDTEDSLSDRILKAEHQLYPLCIRAISQEILNKGVCSSE
jgi:phosphoribosylglycinamide formyltransferase 1